MLTTLENCNFSWIVFSEVISACSYGSKNSSVVMNKLILLENLWSMNVLTMYLRTTYRTYLLPIYVLHFSETW